MQRMRIDVEAHADGGRIGALPLAIEVVSGALRVLVQAPAPACRLDSWMVTARQAFPASKLGWT
jgi:hypothetical protein